jgi:hypothetical protein
MKCERGEFLLKILKEREHSEYLVVDCILVAQDRDQLQALVNVIMNLQIP